MRNYFLIYLFLITIIASYAQKTVIIPIETKNNALVLSTDKDNRLNITYFGKRLKQTGDYAGIEAQYKLGEEVGQFNNAYTSSGSTNLSEPALTITHADGNNSTDLKYVSYTVSYQLSAISYQQKKNESLDSNVQITSIVLKDEVYPVEVTLFYKTYAKENVIEQWTVIKNNGTKDINLKKYASANLYFVARDYYLTHYNGVWAREMRPEETKLTAGMMSIDTKLGARADVMAPPSFQISFDRPATEDEGKVLLGQLAWTGNFKIDFSLDIYHNLSLFAGINPYASDYPLAKNKEFKTPSFIYTYSEKGRGEASRNLHSWARKYRLLDGEGQRLTLLNNWEATGFDFDEKKLVGLFKGAKDLGVDMFLLDDGWFANKYPRNDDHAGLGDWQENVKKLPSGIGYLIKEAKAAGIKFGIWIEPEMVNPKSELYEKHLDWVLREPARPEKYYRNQLVLDMSNPAVQDHVFGILDTLFTKNPELAFIKWDCNAVIFNPHSMYLEKTGQSQSQVYVDYVRGLYKVLERVRAKYPKVPMMLCSGGGARADYEALKYFTEFWLSDDTDPLERVFIQWDNSYFFPAIVHCNHVTDWSKASMKYRTDVAMMGKLGFDVAVDKLPAKDLKSAQNAVATYNGFKDIVWHGDLYRLQNPHENPVASLMYLNEAKTHAVMFNYLVSNRFDFTYSPTPIRLKGLDPTKKYKIKEVNLYPETKTTLNESAEYSGDFLMSVGFNPDINLGRKSVVIEIIGQ